jgi:hypothetical protein
MWPERMRDPRLAPDDGEGNYLTQAEELARSVRVAASREKVRLLEEAGDVLKKCEKIKKEQESYDEFDDEDDDDYE